MARPDYNRKVRQENLREQLATGGHLQHVIELLGKVERNEEPEKLAAYKVVLDTKLKLINKFLPDLKAVELTGEGGNPLGEVLNDIMGRSDGLPSEQREQRTIN